LSDEKANAEHRTFNAEHRMKKRPLAHCFSLAVKISRNFAFFGGSFLSSF